MLKGRGQSVLVIDKNVENLARIADRHDQLADQRGHPTPNAVTVVLQLGSCNQLLGLHTR